MGPHVFQLQHGDFRQQFANFLDRLATARVSNDEWSSFVITHYPNEFVEKRDGVVFDDPNRDTAEGKRLLRNWAQELRIL